MKELTGRFPEVFKDMERNDIDFKGGCVLFSSNLNTFYNVVFGTGDNLSTEDIEQGFDDYVMVDSWVANWLEPLATVIQQLRDGKEGYDIRGLTEQDGAMMLVKRSRYGNSGDIRSYITNALEMVGYGSVEEGQLYRDLILVHKLR